MGITSLPSGVSRTVVRVRKQTSTVEIPKRDSLSIVRLSALIESFLIVGDISRHSSATIENRRYRLGRILWLAERRGWQSIGVRELQQFFLYLNHGHKETTVTADGERVLGRWDNPQQTKPLSSGSSKSFHATLRTFFRWCVKEGELDICPMDKINAPVDRPDQIQPFTDTQVSAILAAAKKTTNPHRDEAIIYVLIDCGLRVTELCSLTLGDVNFNRGEISVREGKGGKARYVPFGRNCKRALWTYIQAERRHAEEPEPLFIADSGPGAGANFLTRRGISLLVTRLGKKAGIGGVRCTPHVFRHYFAISFLRNNGNVFALKLALGHTDLDMTNRYVAIAQADLAAVHRVSSPADRLKTGKVNR